MYLPDNFPAFGRELVASGRYEAEELALIRRHILPGDAILEIGAGFGVTTLSLASRASSVLALEPDPRMFAALIKNTATRKNVTTAMLAVSTSPDDVILHLNAEPWNSSMHATPEHGEIVTFFPTRAIPLARLLEGEGPTALVMDCEGMEAQLIVPGLPWGDCRTLIIEEHPFYADPAAWHRTLETEGFREVDRAGNALGGTASVSVWRKG